MPDLSHHIAPTVGARSLGDFLSHGVLPFVGRDVEMTRLAAFWEAAPEATRMRCAFLSGEAGIGKSRLIGELLRLPSVDPAATVHVRLYPDSDSALAPLLAHAIWSSGVDRTLRGAAPAGSIGSVRDALRRMVNLRPTLVVIEDIHLLRGETLSDFATLLDVIAEYPLSLLLAARPVEDAVRGTIEPYLVEEIELEGLHEDAFRDLWQTLFHERVSEEIVATIMRTTLGNPLALRSGLRGSLKAGVLSAGSAPSPDFALPRLARNLERQVQILSAGMTAHLDRSERDAALALAALGEVFAHETAERLLGDMSGETGALVSRGIIIASGSSRPPLTGDPGNEPLLAFTHSLLHRELARICRPDPERILDLVIAKLPLHSTIPFQILLRHAAQIAHDPDRVPHAIRILLAETDRLNQTSDWELGEQIWRTAAALLEEYRADPSIPDASLLRAAVIRTRLTMLSRDVTSQEHLDLLDELERLTTGKVGEEMCGFRLDLLRNRLWGEFRRDDCDPGAILEEAERIVEAEPGLIGTTAFIRYLGTFANMVSTRGDAQAARRVEGWLERITSHPEIDDEHHKRALEEIAPNLFWFFLTPDELRSKLDLIARLEAVVDSGNFSVAMWKTLLLEKIGRIDDAVAEAERLLPRLKATGQNYLHSVFRLPAVVAGASRGEPLEKIDQQLRAMLAAAPESIGPRLKKSVGLRLVTISLLCGDIPRAISARDEFLDGRALWGVHAVLMALESGDLDGAIKSLVDTDDTHGTIEAASRLDAADEGVRIAARAQLVAELEDPILKYDEILSLRAIVGMADRIVERDHAGVIADRDSLERVLSDALERGMEWLAERRLVGYMKPLLARFSHHFGAKRQDRWERCIIELEDEERRRRKIDVPTRLRITMLGRIEVVTDDEAHVGLRTGRLKTLLGVLVADRLLQRHLSHAEICRIVAGSDLSPEQARKGMNLAVHRLREILGHEAIDTSGPTPALDIERVEVDLLEAHDLLELAERMAIDGQVARARHALLAALEIIAGEVPYPGLYDNFFEASREDFEHRLRSAVIAVSGRLLREGEIAGAEETLRMAFEGMPEDEEIAELLCDAMILLGRRTEAERVRMRLGMQS